ncbi:MAG: hypothetical protein K1X81_02600 [Bacteroidia bacterium]|nr:hypothetical protein [Bacteroidia bacterium]
MTSPLDVDIDAIHRYLKKSGVTVIFDVDGETEATAVGSLYSWEPKDKILTISLPVAHTSQRKKTAVFKIIRKIHNDGGLLWKKSKSEVLQTFGEYQKEDPDQETLEFFKPILPIDDFNALKLSMFLRYEDKKGNKNNVQRFKNDIRNRFGDRGGNIANLCTAGYFDEELKSLYLRIPREEFKEYYEMVVGDKARALFIHHDMGVDEIDAEVEKMFLKATKYHMGDFKIHGKGADNVKTLREFIKSRTGKEKYKIHIKYEDPKLPAIECIVNVLQTD